MKRRSTWKGGKKAGVARRVAAGICVDCPNPTTAGTRRCVACRERNDVSRKVRHAKLKDEVFAAYGGYVCKCCKETRKEFLHIDHANGDGAAHRRQIGDKTGANMYAWLKKNNFPAGFQVLCANCNWSRGRYGYCPHERERDSVSS